MSELHIVVCVKVVPKPEEIRVDYQTHLLNRANVRSEINPPDMNAIELALKLKDRHGGRVDILSMGPPYFEPYLRVGLAMGADHIFLLSDRVFAGADTLATTYTLAAAVRKICHPDLVICGEESSDGATGQVPAGLAEWLDYPQLTLLDNFGIDFDHNAARGERSLKGGHEIIEVPLPCVISVKTACNEPRFMDYRIKPWAFEEGRVTVWDSFDINTDQDCIGLTGSPTIVTDLIEAPSRERKKQFLSGSPEEIAEQIIQLFEHILKCNLEK